MKTIPIEKKIENIESDIQYIRNKVDEIHETLILALQSHAEEKIMSAKEVSEFLDMDINLLYTKCNRGEIPFFKAGKLFKFKKTELIAWMKKQGKKDIGSIDDMVNRYIQKNVLKG